MAKVRARRTRQGCALSVRLVGGSADDLARALLAGCQPWLEAVGGGASRGAATANAVGIPPIRGAAPHSQLAAQGGR